ncbi:uncharacterized protein [Cicer arietinum]|uniref:uncharacterized protein n=1 Tax=Cicer arietinum TaxID=3827 RepID=UPI003CC64829
MEVINQSGEDPPMAEEGSEIAIDGTLYGVEDESANEEEVDEEEEEEEEEDMEDENRLFENGLDALELIGDNNSGVPCCQRIIEYNNEHQALANKKRKSLKPCQSEGTSSKKARQDDVSGVSSAEMMELMNFEMGGRSKKKGPKKKGRRKGSKKKLDENLSRMLGDANLHYANRRYDMAIAVLSEVVRLEPNLPDPYHILGLVHSAIGDYEKEMGFYMIAALLSPKDPSLWKILFAWCM